MLRIRVGESWKRNPAYLNALRALADGRSRAFSPRDIVDVLGFEVDGVDLAQGAAEAPLLDAMLALVRAARPLSQADGRTVVELPESGLELRLERRDDELRLSLRSTDDGLEGPVVALDPAGFWQEVRRGARALLDDLVAIHPALGRERVVQQLERELAPGPRRRQVSTRRALEPTYSPLVPMGRLHLALRTDRQALCVLEGRQPCWSHPEVVRGFLDLAALVQPVPDPDEPEATSLADVAVDRVRSTVVFGRRGRVGWSDLRDALVVLGAELVRSAGPDAADRLEPALQRLSQAPGEHRQEQLPVGDDLETIDEESALPSRGLRRLVLRPAWRVDAPGPRPRLSALGPLLFVRTASHVESRDGEGRLRWSAAAGDAIALPTKSGTRVLGRDTHGALVVLDGESGRRLARLPTALTPRLRAGFELDDGRLVAHDGARIIALTPGHDELDWSFESGAGRALSVTSVGRGLFVGCDDGWLHGVRADGRLAWRVSSGLELVESTTADRARGLGLAVGLDEDGQAAMVAVRLATGEHVWRCVFAGVRPSAPVLAHDRVLLGYETGPGGMLVALDLETGRLLWKRRPPLGGAVAPVVAGDRVLVVRSGGGLVAYAHSGVTAYRCAPADPDLALSPVRPRQAAVGDGIVVVPAAMLHVFDVNSGRSLATLEPAELAPDSLALLPGPVLVSASLDGLIEAWRTTGHLSVVPNPEYS